MMKLIKYEIPEVWQNNPLFRTPCLMFQPSFFCSFTGRDVNEQNGESEEEGNEELRELTSNSAARKAPFLFRQEAA